MTFAAGERSKSLVFTATEDTEDDDGESVELGFGDLPGGIGPGGTATASVAIADDDDPRVGVSFESGSYAVDEGATTTITVTLSADPERTVAIDLLTTNRDGASDSDYSGGASESDLRQRRYREELRVLCRRGQGQ